MPIKIDLKGCCVTREAFSYNKDKDIIIDKYWFQKPLVTIFSKPLDVDLDYVNKIKIEMINKNLTEFIVRERTSSIRKEFFSEYNKSDYFLMDLVDERMTLMQVNDFSYVEYIQYFKKRF